MAGKPIQMSIRFSAKERAMLEEMAEEDDMTMTNMISTLIRAESKRRQRRERAQEAA